MLQPRIRPICNSYRSLFSSVTRRYASRQEQPLQASTVTKDATVTTTTSAPPARKAAGAFQMQTYKPRTPGVRHLKRPINDHLWKGKPYAKLTFAKVGHGKGGRNNTGRITMRHRGGGARRRIRTVDFKRDEPGKHIVERIEYDPNRSAHLALVENTLTQRKSYIIAAEGMRAGDSIESFRAGIPKTLLASMGGVMDPGMLAAKTAFRGNCLPMKMVPMGTQVFNVGSTTNKGAVFCRSAGTHATVIAKNDVAGIIRDVTVRLQSGEVRRVSAEACATIGVASNPHWQFRQLGKAGRSRHLNIRPTVRGLAMNAADHAHGGGRGKSKGNVHPVSIWGTPVSLNVFSMSLFGSLTELPTGQRWFQDPSKAQSQQARRSGESAQPGQAQEHQLSSSTANSASCCTSLALCTLCMHQTMYIIEIYLDVQLHFPVALKSSYLMFSLSASRRTRAMLMLRRCLHVQIVWKARTGS
jgi:ribosomal protein L2